MEIFRDEFVLNVQASDAYKRWARTSPGDKARWIAFRDAVLANPETAVVPAMSTAFGRALIAAGKLHMSVIDIGSRVNFGSLLPARLPESMGNTYTVTTAAQLQERLTNAPLGSVIEVSGTIDMQSQQLAWNRDGSPSTVTTLRGASGAKIIYAGYRDPIPPYLNSRLAIVITGSYFRIEDLEWDGVRDIANYGEALKISQSGGQVAHHIEINRCTIRRSVGQGIQIGSGEVSDIQVWNTRFYNNGTATTLDHGIYWVSGGSNCVLANCLFSTQQAYALQMYTAPHNLIVTCCTFDGGVTRGGVVVGGSSTCINNVIVGCLSTNANTVAGFNVDDTIYSPNTVYDSIGYGNDAGTTEAGMTYVRVITADPQYADRPGGDFRLQAGSPAIGYIDPARYEYIPPLDIDNQPRSTADAGCYRA